MLQPQPATNHTSTSSQETDAATLTLQQTEPRKHTRSSLERDSEIHGTGHVNGVYSQ